MEMKENFYRSVQSIICRPDAVLQATQNGWRVISAMDNTELLRVDAFTEMVGNTNGFSDFQPYGTIRTVKFYMMGRLVKTDTSSYIVTPDINGVEHVQSTPMKKETSDVLALLKHVESSRNARKQASAARDKVSKPVHTK